MATAAELLSDVVEEVLVIDSSLRTINIPSSVTNLGVESDDETTRLKFQMPRFNDGIDLKDFVVRINYENANGEGDVYEATDKVVNEDTITFSWLVGRFAVMYRGTVKFIVCLKEITDGIVDREFNTTVASLPVLAGLETDEAVVEDYPDAISAVAKEAVLSALSTDLKGDAGYTPVKGVDYFTEEEINELIEEVSNTVKGDYANAYKQSASGDVIRVDDVSPIEHTVGVTVKSKNMCPMSVFDVMHPNGSITEYDPTTHTITLLSDSPGSQGQYVSPVKNLIVGETYTMSFDIKGTPDKKVKCGWDKKDIQVTLTDEYVRYSSTLVATHNSEAIIFYNKATADGGLSAGEYMQFDNVQVVHGEETEYSEYVDPSTVTLTRCSKNLLPLDNFTYTPSTSKATFADGVLTVNGYIAAHRIPAAGLAGKRLIISCTSTRSGDKGGGLAIEFKNASNVKISGVYHQNDLSSSFAFTVPEGTASIVVFFYGSGNADTVGTATYRNVQLELGDTITEYEAHVGNTYTPNADGTVDSVYSVSPTMTLYTGTPGVTINATYNRDTNTLLEGIMSGGSTGYPIPNSAIQSVILESTQKEVRKSEFIGDIGPYYPVSAEAVYDYVEGKFEGNYSAVEIDDTLTTSGAAADAKATGDRLANVEYQIVVTEEAYEHKDLPTGEKTVTVNGDSTWGDKVYVVSGDDMIPRTTFNKTFPHEGITLVKDGDCYHISGKSTATSRFTICFCHDSTSANIVFDRDISGKTFKLHTFTKELTNVNLYFVATFYDSNSKAVSILDSKGNVKSNATTYIGTTKLFYEYEFSIPENSNISYMQLCVSVPTDCELDHDFKVYLTEANNTKDVTLEEPTTKMDTETVTRVFSFPYPSVVTTKAPLGEYINYRANNAKGDTVTYLTPEAFGAVGDGYTNDTEAIKQCLATAVNTKQYVLMAKKYLTFDPIEIYGTGLNININDVVYSGNDSAVKIKGQQNIIKIHSIDSSGVGIKFLGDGAKQEEWTLNNNLEVNTIKAKSHGIVLESTTANIYQNVINFSLIKAGGDDCYGIANFVGKNTYITENNYYGGHITTCDWAVYGVAGNSRLVNIQVEYKVKGGFYITGYVNIINPRWSESSRDGEYKFLKFVGNNIKHVKIYNNLPLTIDEIDLTESSETSEKGTYKSELHCAELNFPIITRKFGDGNGVNTGAVLSHSALVIGKYLILKPYMAYRKVVTTEVFDTRLLGQEETEAEIKAMTQLPTRFVVDSVSSDIYLHESYCALGFNEFEVEQVNGYTCKVYDKLGELVFDGTDKGDGLYNFKCYKDCDLSKPNPGAGLLCVDFVGHHWEVAKINLI